MKRTPEPQRGDGTAWLSADHARGDYVCYWYAGPNDGVVVEHERAANATDAVAWGLARTTRVRLRSTDAHTYWAGTAARPEGFTRTWNADAPEGAPALIEPLAV
jgi:hypothetical protein